MTAKPERAILIRYGEIFLKSQPVRQRFENILFRNIRAALGVRHELRKECNRIMLFVRSQDLDKACERLSRVFGVVSFSPVDILDTSDKREIAAFVKKNYAKWIPVRQTFAVRVKRLGNHDYNSQELASLVGKYVNRKVNLSKPDVTIGIEVRGDKTFVFSREIPGLGGLPVGASGKVLCLLSGGIDSPVAAWLAMKRGCDVEFVHFHSFPLTTKKSVEKTRELLKLLKPFQGRVHCHFVPFAEVQKALKVKAEPQHLITLYRRFMLRIAARIAEEHGCAALVTGENLAQVSSQTLTNLAVIQDAVRILVLRPVLTYDKQEIIALAQRLGTYDTSIQPQEDCCTLFTPPHSSASSDLKQILKMEKRVAIQKLVKNALKKTKEEEF